MREFVTYDEVQEDSPAYLMKRVRGHAGTYVTQASVSSLSASVYDLSSTTPDTAIAGPTSFTVSSCIFDTLQTDARWSKDSTGYNVAITAPASWFPTGGRNYSVELTVTPTSGEAFKLVWVLYARSVAGS